MPTLRRTVVIHNEEGLHARPAALFVKVAKKFDASVSVRRGSQRVNGKSIMGILMLGAGKGAKITIEVEGIDAEEALEELIVIVEENLG
ncbi:MAG: HPr family phosphocarrier protein [Candidatus Omnitrophica bacterium]|nr:HPr family phosphocarrier protein [Candidatus Omnitrophota bacterium]